MWPGKFDDSGQRRAAPLPSPEPPCCVERYIHGTERSPGRLIHGDLCDEVPGLAPQSIDFAFLDPPFRVGKNHRLNGGVADESGATPVAYDDRAAPEAYLAFLDDAIQSVIPTLKHTGILAVHTDYRTAHWVRILLDEHLGADLCINELIWHYGLGNARNRRSFLRKHDTIAVYGRSPDYFFNMIRGEVTKAQAAKYCHEDDGGRYMLSYGRKYYLKGGKPLDSVLEIPALAATDRERTGYPTQKPTRLLRLLIDAFCPPDGVVLDPVCGSGTTGVAAVQSGRAFTLVDRSPLAIQHAMRRIVQASLTTGGINFQLNSRRRQLIHEPSRFTLSRVEDEIHIEDGSADDPVESWVLLTATEAEPRVHRCWFRPRASRRRAKPSQDAKATVSSDADNPGAAGPIRVPLGSCDKAESPVLSPMEASGKQSEMRLRIRTRSGGLYDFAAADAPAGSNEAIV